MPDAEITDLLTAIDDDSGLGVSVPGPATSLWLGRLLLAARDLGIEGAGGAIAIAVAKFLGIG